jgi:uncharacterized RDD family membrane protein YckC
MTTNVDPPYAGHPLSVPTTARPYQGRTAGIVTRLLANGIDLLVVIAVLAAIYGGIAAFTFLWNPRGFSWPDRLGWSMPVIGFVIAVPYLTLSWSAAGRTYGDNVLGLRVVSHNGRRLHATTALLRAVLYVLFPLGLLWVAISPRNRSLQDVIMRSRVIYDWTPAKEPIAN